MTTTGQRRTASLRILTIRFVVCAMAVVEARLSSIEGSTAQTAVSPPPAAAAVRVLDVVYRREDTAPPPPLHSDTRRRRRHLQGGLIMVGNNGIPSDAFPLDQCEGDCDNDRDCRDGLDCFQRREKEYVPGCGSGTDDTAGRDVCYDPDRIPSGTVIRVGNNGDPENAFPLEQCQGDCDNDEECRGSLVCYQRRSSDTSGVPGCVGDVSGTTDYCYDPADRAENTLDKVGDEDEPEGVFPLKECQGDCDRDSDCRDGLKCFQRRSSEKSVPGCVGTTEGSADYCIDENNGPPPAPTPNPVASGSTDGNLLFEVISKVSKTPEDLDDRSTPAGMALDWLINDSQVSVDKEDDIIQRYAMTVMDFSLEGTTRSRSRSECDWSGVECRSGEVREIAWCDEGLRGEIPKDIYLLEGLEVLDLAENRVKGKIPGSLYLLDNLEKLYLQSNRISGTISSGLGNLDKLERLYLGDNNLTGKLPKELGSKDAGQRNVRPLEWISLYDNDLTGTIPQDLNLRDLVYLDLGRNDFKGTIPKDWVQGEDHMQRLRHLYLDYNRFSGSLPDDWHTLGMGRVHELVLNDNKFTGEVPGDYESRRKLNTLEVQNNRFDKLHYSLCNHMVFVAGEMTVLYADCDICRCEFFCPETCYD